MPGFMMGAVIFAVRVACDRLGLDLPAWLAQPAGEDGGSLTALFERVPRDFDFTLEAPLDLAEKVADVWHHPDCPEEIREALNVGTSDFFNLPNGEEGWRRVYQTAPCIRALLAEHAAREEARAGVKRRVELGFSGKRKGTGDRSQVRARPSQHLLTSDLPCDAREMRSALYHGSRRERKGAA